MTDTVVATANILRDLPRPAAAAALQQVLATGPDLVGLQEWGLSRLGPLHATGSVRLTSAPPLPGRNGDWSWVLTLLGGCVVGARVDRYRLRDARAVLLQGVALADNPARRCGIEPPRIAVTATYDDRTTGRRMHLVSYHLSPGVQGPDGYRTDRPRVVARHRAEVSALQRLVDRLRAFGDEVWAVGDANLHGLRIDGLTSAWQGREDAPATFGRHRRIDDVFGPRRVREVELVETGSDHRAVVARYA